MKDNSTNILLEFDDEVQQHLKEVDYAMRQQSKVMREEARSASLSGKKLVMDAETAAWLKIMDAYGILFNRAVEAGWINDNSIEDKDGKIIV